MKLNWLAVLLVITVLISCQPDEKKATVVEKVEEITPVEVETKEGDLLTNKYWYSPTNFVNVPQWRFFDTKGMYKGWIEGKGEPAKLTGSYKIVNEGKSMEIYNMTENHGTENYDIVKLTADTLEVSAEGAPDMSITFIHVKK
ncbi:MAG: hypothetical protein R2753_05050 [Chitinophagales bacterium]